MMSDFSIETSLFRLLCCEFLDIIRILFWLLSAALGPAGQGPWAAGAGALLTAVFVPMGHAFTPPHAGAEVSPKRKIFIGAILPGPVPLFIQRRRDE